ncbi:MAG: nucleotide exchange factor GrpE [Melioribacter sp.]|nr:nucleotide exchange factor GrpE [Melioribacter sp.]
MEENELNKEQKTPQENENNIPIEREDKSEPETENQQTELALKIAELEFSVQKIGELEKQNSELRDSLLRKAAEFENYKRRSENDQLNILKYAAESFIRNILPVYDDLERSLSHIDDENNIDSTKKGLMLVFEKFGKILENQGIKRIDAKGKPFDVHLHEALMQQPAEGVAPHTVLDVLEPGYMYKDRVLRHAKVIVSSETASNEELNSENQSDTNQEG